MKTGYLMSEDDYDTLIKAQSALTTLTKLLYEAQNDKISFDACELADLISFPTAGMKQVADNLIFKSN